MSEIDPVTLAHMARRAAEIADAGADLWRWLEAHAPQSSVPRPESLRVAFERAERAERQLAEARETNTRLNRRAQTAERLRVALEPLAKAGAEYARAPKHTARDADFDHVVLAASDALRAREVWEETSEDNESPVRAEE